MLGGNKVKQDTEYLDVGSGYRIWRKDREVKIGGKVVMVVKREWWWKKWK